MDGEKVIKAFLTLNGFKSVSLKDKVLWILFYVPFLLVITWILVGQGLYMLLKWMKGKFVSK
ncbi:hypothetical protein BEH_07700 [Priestia filamentosa]|uniref:Uncharacterized protein n=1 Tax=Priestia filamentosa TaxID=1402861 RepID=A0A0H4KI71_9BACI|nr:hypothetical protein [Priestia filamentosa]AKO91994.1 hypothetical protein BEH_07700 [Priestia filamentosa]